MNYEIILLLTGLMLFAYWIVYAMGGPLSDEIKKVDIKAILFAFPYFLAVRRLKKIGIYGHIRAGLMDELAMVSDPVQKRRIRLDKKRDIYEAGREFFTWEKSFLCPICLHWWLTVLVGVVCLYFDSFNARADLYLAAFVYLVNHFIIRKIS